MGDKNANASYDFIENAKQVILDELEAIQQLTSKLDADFNAACEAILNCNGRVIVSGMGKSGHIGNKIAATLASTGTPSFFVHPSEALHGDLGMITAHDIVVSISNSGSTDELITLCSVVKRQGTKIIAMTGKPDSLLSSLADFHLDIHVEKDQCIISVVGNFIADEKGTASRIFDSLREIPLRMISFGGSKHNVTLLVSGKHKKEALNALNDSLFNGRVKQAV